MGRRTFSSSAAWACYPKAARFIDMMEQDRIDRHGGPGQGAKLREILVGPEYLQKVGR